MWEQSGEVWEADTRSSPRAPPALCFARSGVLPKLPLRQTFPDMHLGWGGKAGHQGESG